jgi:hypothetical protein
MDDESDLIEVELISYDDSKTLEEVEAEESNDG